MTNMVPIPINQAKVPAGMRERLQAGIAVNKNFAGGVRDAFPMLSIKGKVFTVRVDGAQQVIADPQTKLPYNALDVILVNASEQLAKAYYIKGFVDDDSSFMPPDCWSLDSIRPDPSVANKVSPTCQNCPMNQFGSAPSRDAASGKRGGKACSDNRRVALVMPTQLGQPDTTPLVFMLKVPATSLKNLKKYADLLERQGWEPAACVTQLSFDYHEAYPKLLFNFVDALSDAEYAQATGIAESKLVKDMLVAPDFDATATVLEPTPNDALQPRVRQAAPVFVDPNTAGTAPVDTAPMQRTTPAAQQQGTATQQKPDLKAVDPTLIELPDGKLFNPVTKEYVERPQPKVEMPAEDPATITLPDGRFFNTTTRQYVTSGLVGAPVVTDAPPAGEPAKRTRPSRAKAKDSPAANANVQPQAEQQASPPVENPVGNGHAATAANTTSGVEPAPAVLESILDSILPKR